MDSLSYYILTFIIAIFGLVFPIFLFGPEISYIYLIFLPFGLLTRKNYIFRFPKRGWPLYLLIVFHVSLLVIYRNDIETLLNLGMLLVSYTTVFYLIMSSQKAIGQKTLEDRLFRNFLIIGVLSFFISIFLTFIEWPTAPKLYPWDAVLSGHRLLLIRSKAEVSHTISMWFFAFAALYILKKYFSGKQNMLIVFASVPIILLFLILTKSRLAILFILIICLACLAYKNLISYKVIPAFFFTLFVLLTLASFSKDLKHVATDKLLVIQNRLPFLRLTANKYDKALFAGRDILNKVMIDLAITNPFWGVGDSHPAITGGVTYTGELFAYTQAGKAMTSESAWIMAAKYGLVYFSLQMLLILVPIIRAFKRYYKDNIFVVSVCSMIFASCLSSVFIPQFYSVGAIHAIILIIFLLTPYPQLRVSREI